mmetsp:Transcript_13620/g.19977  ORF Transcript_13620/g.19977 Transcript_13620/m.19977 type:complete len:169 (-) Transcript_13620:541-1047(-)
MMCLLARIRISRKMDCASLLDALLMPTVSEFLTTRPSFEASVIMQHCAVQMRKILCPITVPASLTQIVSAEDAKALLLGFPNAESRCLTEVTATRQLTAQAADVIDPVRSKHLCACREKRKLAPLATNTRIVHQELAHGAVAQIPMARLVLIAPACLVQSAAQVDASS